MSTTVNSTTTSDFVASLQKRASTSSTTTTDAQSKFLTLLTEQLKNQDPLNPMDNAQVTSQMAQIQTVTGIEKLHLTQAIRRKRKLHRHGVGASDQERQLAEKTGGEPNHRRTPARLTAAAGRSGVGAITALPGGRRLRSCWRYNTRRGGLATAGVDKAGDRLV